MTIIDKNPDIVKNYPDAVFDELKAAFDDFVLDFSSQLTETTKSRRLMFTEKFSTIIAYQIIDSGTFSQKMVNTTGERIFTVRVDTTTTPVTIRAINVHDYRKIQDEPQ